ncbi:hypothetical protein Tco_0039635 [Tanacetum coccineum]
MRKPRSGAFWSLNEDILKIYYYDNQYDVSIKEDTAYTCLHSPKTTKERRSIRSIQKKSIRRIEDIDLLIRASRLNKVMADKGKKSSMETFVPNDKADYYSGITSITVNGKIAYELKGKFLDDLHNNAFSGTNKKDAVEHIEYYLKIIDPIKLPNVDHDKLRIVIFPISLTGGARRWFDRTKESITCWVDLTAKFFRKYYPPSRIKGNNTPVIKWGPANLRFEGWLATKFVNYKTMDIFTKGALWDYWKMRGDEIEVDVKPWTDAGVWIELKPVKHTCNLPGAYHIGNSFHYQDLKWYEALENSKLKDEALRNKAIMEGLISDDESEDEYNDLTITSEEACRAYQEIFQMMDEGWMVTRTETLEAKNIDEYWWRIYKSGDLKVLES